MHIYDFFRQVHCFDLAKAPSGLHGRFPTEPMDLGSSLLFVVDKK
jgi:hypothetical protein